MKIWTGVISLGLIMVLGLAGCGSRAVAQTNSVSYSLKSGLQDGRMVFIGVGGDIDSQVNPTLTAKVGETVVIQLTSGEGAEHNIALPDFGVDSPHVDGQGNSITVSFVADKSGTFPYYCNLPGHRQAGMEGKLVVGGDLAANPGTPTASSNTTTNTSSTSSTNMDMSMTQAPVSSAPTNPAAPATGADIVRDPTDLPGPIGDRGPTTVQINLEAKEVVGQLNDGATFTYWTFNGKVPGPFFRVRVGDTVVVHLKNDANNMMPHSVDFHAVTGPGGGAIYSTTPPGGETSFTFKALKPGLYVYHCATPMVAEHIANGMYGMILVEPEGGLPKVDREFYVMQGEIYTAGKFGDKGAQVPDTDKLLSEQPTYFVFNGAVNSLTTEHPLQAKVGETVRIFFGVGGPNFISSFHMIGEIFDHVYNLGSISTPPMTDVQTTLVPPGDATIVEVQLQEPGKYILVDHALSRMELGLQGWLVVTGPADPTIYNGTPMPGSGH